MPFLFEGKGSNGPRGTDLPTGVTTRLATSPIRDDLWRPEAFPSLFESFRLQNVVWANLEAFATTDTELKEVCLRDTSRGANREFVRGCENVARFDGKGGACSCHDSSDPSER
jgi:hypothetical protein